MVGRTLGHYRILDQIGAGGMGVVYRAHDLRLDRDVALKVLPPGTLGDESARRRFRREALALSRLSHPNIETVHDFDTQEEVDFLALEMVEGVSLDARVAAGPLAEREVVSLGVQLARGLEAAHKEGIVHRDLKPSNLRVTHDGQLKILDFGLARVMAQGSREVTLSALTEGPGSMMGTLGYMSPEQLQGAPADARSDLFAVGAVLYELATGRRPFVGNSPAEVMYAIVNTAPEPPRVAGRAMVPGLQTIVLKALEKDPELRYQSARELRVDLERLTLGAGVAVAERHPPRPRFRQLAAAAVVLATALAAVMLYLNLGGVRDRIAGHPSAGLQSLAVLPLTDPSGDADQEYFADGMTEELITSLTKISALTVISQASVIGFKGSSKPLRDIAAALRVAMLVQGSVRRSGERVRITAQLIEAASGRNLWADSYEGDLRDVLRLQSDVALSIAREIRVRLTPQEEERLGRAREVDPRAHELCMRARLEASHMTHKSSLRAIQWFEQALAIDPGYAGAHAGLAEAHYFTSNFFVPPEQAMPQVRMHARRALELDPDLASARTMLSIVTAFYDFKPAQAELELRRAVEVAPGNAMAHHWRGYVLLQLGHLDEAEAEFRRAVELDPLSPAHAWHLVFPAFYRRDFDRAIEELRSEANVDSDNWLTYSLLGECYEQKGDFARATATLRRALDLGANTWVNAAIGRVHARAGRPDSARAVIRELKQMSARGVFVQDYAVATIYGYLGEKDRAFEHLEKALREHQEDLILLKIDPRVDPLRSDPRYDDLLRRVGLGT